MEETNATTSVPQVNFRFKISDIGQLKVVWSPEFWVQAIPWKVELKKIEKDKESLAFFLHCAKKEKPPNWSHIAFATIKLLPFDTTLKPIERCSDPFHFDSKTLGYGIPELIAWDDLFNVDKCYVKDDAINLEITIEAANPMDQNRSISTFESFDACCDGVAKSTFRMTVKNIEALVAVRSPQFMLQNLPWELTIFKGHSKNIIGTRLLLCKAEKGVSCESKISFKLISSKNHAKSIARVQEKCFNSSDVLLTMHLMSWNELLEPGNGFVNDNSITIEVEIMASKPQGAVPNPEANSRDQYTKRQKLECSICSETMSNQDISITPCGHLFCSICIPNSVEFRKTCPLCSSTIYLKDLHRVFLPL